MHRTDPKCRLHHGCVDGGMAREQLRRGGGKVGAKQAGKHAQRCRGDAHPSLQLHGEAFFRI